MIFRFVLYIQSFQAFINICNAYNSDFVFPEQLYDGSQCLLNTNNENGVCRELTKCSKILREIETGLKRFDFQDHCSLFGSKKLVCCPMQQGQQVSVEFGLRPEKSSQQIGNDEQFSSLLSGTFGSEEAVEGQFPFMASLGYLKNNKSNDIDYKCGGSLISTLYVLTAAHCMINTNNHVPVEVRLGFVNQRISTKGVQRISIANLNPHPNYNMYAHYYDIALIKLGKSVEITETIKPISLYTNPIKSADAENGHLLTAGFNLKNTVIENPAKVLKFFSLNLVNKSVCAKAFAGLNKLPFGLDESMKCGKDINEIRGFDVCQGDSGGPLLLRSGNTFCLAGVISFGIGCTGIIPTVYISIYHFLDWIENHVQSS